MVNLQLVKMCIVLQKTEVSFSVPDLLALSHRGIGSEATSGANDRMSFGSHPCRQLRQMPLVSVRVPFHPRH